MTTTSSAAAGRKYRLGELLVDLDDGRVWVGDERVDLQPKLLAILTTLVEAYPRLVTKTELLDAVWPEQIVSEAALTQRVKELRRLLRDDPRRPRYIETVSRRGYRLVCPVARQMPARDPSEGPRVVQLVERPPERPGAAALAVATRRRWLVAVALGLALAAAAAVLVWQLTGRQPGRTPAPVRRAVAVMPFRDLTDRSKGGWLPTALGEMLSAELAAGGAIRVVSGEALAAARRELSLREAESYSPETLARLRTLVGADLAVTGSCIAAADRSDWLRVDAFVQDAARGETLLALSESGETSQFLPLVARLGARLRDALGVAALTERERGELRASMPAPAAVAAYAEGLEAMRRHNFRAALGSLQQAAQLDPGSARVHQALSAAWNWLGYEKQYREEIRLAFERSAVLPRPDQLAIEADYREATGDRPRALEVARTIFDLYPDSIDAGLNLALQQAASGDSDGSVRTLLALRALPPPAGQDPRIDLQEAWLHVSDMKAKLRAADRAHERAEAIGSRLVVAAAEIQRGQALLALGDPDQALRAFGEARRLRVAAGDRWAEAKALFHIGLVLRREGRLAESAENYGEALAIARDVGSPLGEAQALAGLGAIRGEQGDLVVARASLGRAVALFEELGKREPLGDAEVDWARLGLVAGFPAEAEKHARAAIRAYDGESLVAGHATALALTALACFESGRRVDGSAALEQAGRLATGLEARELQFFLALAGASERAASGDWRGAAGRVDAGVQQLAGGAWSGLRFQARLLGAEIRARSGDTVGSAADLRALAAEARAAGHGLVAQRADELRTR